MYTNTIQDLIKDNLKTADSWNRCSDAWYDDIEEHIGEIINKPEIAFPVNVYQMLREAFPSFKGLKVCVPSSGDNTAVYAFHLLGAEVTSIDLSEKQIENALKVAKKYNWKIDFICDDSTFLSKIADDSFDLIYTSNGVHVWIPDLALMYRHFNRVLKPNGTYVFFESHPISRPFDDSGPEIKIVRKYSDVGPMVNEGVKRYAWRMQDFINSLTMSNFEIRKMHEFNSSMDDFILYDYMYNSVEERTVDHCRKYDWLQNPWAALPQCFAMALKKKQTLVTYNDIE